MTKSLTNWLYLKQCLYTFRINGAMPIKESISELNKIIMDFKNIDVKIHDDEDQVLIVLCSLPPSYKHFVITLPYGKDTIFKEYVKSTLYSNEIRKKVYEGNSSFDDASWLILLGIKGSWQRRIFRTFYSRVCYVLL